MREPSGKEEEANHPNQRARIVLVGSYVESIAHPSFTTRSCQPFPSCHSCLHANHVSATCTDSIYRSKRPPYDGE